MAYDTVGCKQGLDQREAGARIHHRPESTKEFCQGEGRLWAVLWPAPHRSLALCGRNARTQRDDMWLRGRGWGREFFLPAKQQSPSPTEQGSFLINKLIRKGWRKKKRKIQRSEEEEQGEKFWKSERKINLKVSTREAWFPELERVLNSGKDEYFVPENTRAFGAPCRPGLTLHGWGGESGTTAAGRDCWPQAPRRPPPAQGRRGRLDSRPLSTSLYRLHCFSLSFPFPARTWGYHGHRNRRTRMQSYFLPLSALPPPLQNA